LKSGFMLNVFRILCQ